MQKSRNIGWLEIAAKDPAKTALFMRDVFEVGVADPDEQGYRFFDTQAHDVPGGVGPLYPGNDQGWTTVYHRVEDVEAACKRAKALGGRVRVEPIKIPDGTSIAVVEDAEGHPLGLGQISTTQSNELERAPSNCAWFEFVGKEAKDLREFGRQVLGLEFHDTDAQDYAAYRCHDNDLPGGVGRAPEGPGWTTFYLRVRDIQAQAQRAEKAGGRLLLPPMTIPTGDTIAVVASPEGHPLGMVQANETAA